MALHGKVSRVVVEKVNNGSEGFSSHYLQTEIARQ